MINERYPGTNTSKLTKEVFPKVIVKRLRVNGVRSTYYIGVRKRLATNTSSLNEQQLLSISPHSTPLPLSSVLQCEIQKTLYSNGIVMHYQQFLEPDCGCVLTAELFVPLKVINLAFTVTINTLGVAFA